MRIHLHKLFVNIFSQLAIHTEHWNKQFYCWWMSPVGNWWVIEHDCETFFQNIKLFLHKSCITNVPWSTFPLWIYYLPFNYIHFFYTAKVMSIPPEGLIPQSVPKQPTTQRHSTPRRSSSRSIKRKKFDDELVESSLKKGPKKGIELGQPLEKDPIKEFIKEKEKRPMVKTGLLIQMWLIICNNYCSNNVI